ncbi:hypothetical protein LUZ60_017231 [Juncus effusus]|nr:hypothetical protein LUZ60_017231 [Juncus effusus]
MTRSVSKSISSRYESVPDRHEPVIPGLPDHIAEHCLIHLPFPYPSLLRSVSPSWNKTLLSPSFLLTKSKLSLSAPRLFVFSFNPHTLQIQCQSLDPVSQQWFLLPPLPASSPIHPCSIICSSVLSRGEIFLLGDGANCLIYRAVTNSWSVIERLAVPGLPLASCETSDGRIVAVTGDENGGKLSTEIYDPLTDKWGPAAVMSKRIERYDAATINGRIYLTEGWAWPFDTPPRGAIYDSDINQWSEMSLRMREGWTGSSATIKDKIYIVAEYGDSNLKFYDEKKDEWRLVKGGGVPKGVKRPFSVVGDDEERIYVIGKGLDLAIGLIENETVNWEVVKGPSTFAELVPCNSQILYV